MNEKQEKDQHRKENILLLMGLTFLDLVVSLFFGFITALSKGYAAGFNVTYQMFLFLFLEFTIFGIGLGCAQEYIAMNESRKARLKAKEREGDKT
ncbi:MAG: hypothetical protein GY845_25820 [Planctomycetes bacterium]|nr:hypothetical protein [Planctomycetota bacterium]